MRESIGGTALYYIFAVFLIVISVVIGLTINYMSAYRTNNYIVSLIEQKNGYIGDIKQTVKDRYGYNVNQEYIDACVLSVDGFLNGGVVVRIYTYLHFRLPLIPVDIPITVRGETRTIQGTDVKTVKNNINDSLRLRDADFCGK